METLIFTENMFEKINLNGSIKKNPELNYKGYLQGVDSTDSELYALL